MGRHSGDRDDEASSGPSTSGPSTQRDVDAIEARNAGIDSSDATLFGDPSVTLYGG